MQKAAQFKQIQRSYLADVKEALVVLMLSSLSFDGIIAESLCVADAHLVVILSVVWFARLQVIHAIHDIDS